MFTNFLLIESRDRIVTLHKILCAISKIIGNFHYNLLQLNKNVNMNMTDEVMDKYSPPEYNTDIRCQKNTKTVVKAG